MTPDEGDVIMQRVNIVLWHISVLFPSIHNYIIQWVNIVGKMTGDIQLI